MQLRDASVRIAGRRAERQLLEDERAKPVAVRRRCQRLVSQRAAGAPSEGAWWYVVPPGLCITLLVLAVSMLGYQFEELVNPRLREQQA